MNSKQLRFVSEYLVDSNATQAAIRAGYSARTAYSQGCRLLKNVEVSASIQQAMNERQSELIATREQRLSFWTETMRDADTDMRHRLKASELLGRACGDFTIHADVDVKPDTPCTYDLSLLSETELLTLRALLGKAK